jgi:hypothetical protein
MENEEGRTSNLEWPAPGYVHPEATCNQGMQKVECRRLNDE